MQPDTCQSLLREGRAGDLCPALPSSAQFCLAQPSGPSPDPHAWTSGLPPRLLPHSVLCTCFCSLSHWHRVSVKQIHCAVQCPNCSGGGGTPRPAIFLNQGLRKVWKGDLSSFGSRMVSVTITQFCSSTMQTVGEDS